MQLTVGEVAEAIGGRLEGDPGRTITSWHTDSRLVAGGGAFFALLGAEADGHRFVGQAQASGAALLVVEQPVATSGAAVIRVADSWNALFGLARYVLERVRPIVVGITGSNGKTSTKELTAAALAVRHRVHRTTGNLNTETGLPLTVLALEPEHEVAVLEMAMQRAGEIARLAALARPAVGVVTSIGSVHAENFADGLQGVARAKAELLEALPSDGLAVINGDDPFCDRLAARAAAPVARYGLGAGIDLEGLRGEGFSQVPQGGSRFTVRGLPVRLRLEGRHQAQNALAALVVARRLGAGLAEAAAALSAVEAVHRLQRRSTPDGWTMVDDSYNASPESMRAAFSTLRGMEREGRLLAVLGEMRELGPDAEELHRQIGAEAGDLFDALAVLQVGLGRTLAQAAGPGAEVVPDREAAATWVRTHARPGDLVLIKASHGVALDELAQALVP